MSPAPIPGRRRSDHTTSAWLHARFVDAMARLEPQRVVDLSSAVGRLSQRLRGRPRVDDVAAVFSGHPVLSSLDPARVAREVNAAAYRSRALAAVARRHGLRPIERLLDRRSIASLELLSRPQASAVVVTWHFGPGCGLSAAFHLCGIKALAIVRRPLPAPENVLESLTVGGGEEERARALWRAVRHLRDGGHVVVAADGLAGERSRDVPFLGRRLGLSRGPFVLARLSGAPLVPVIATWSPDGQIQLVTGTPIVVNAPRTDAEAFEVAAAAATAAWMERHVLAAPHELRPHTIRWLAASPRV